MGVNQKILTALVAVRTEVLAGNYPVTGICNAVLDQMGDEFESEVDILLPAIRSWPGFSGDSTYPVPHPGMPAKYGYEQHPFRTSRGWWLWASPEYGMKRRELLDFLITYFEGEVNASS